MKIIACNSNPLLVNEVASLLDIPLMDTVINRFADHEINVDINESVRGEDVYVVQSTDSNDHIMELLICMDALKRAAARRITAVIPYFGYSRQDRKSRPRGPISAKLMADLLTVSGASRVLTIDLHAPQIQGFFNIPVDNLYAAPLYIDHIASQYDLSTIVIAATDVGGVPRARYVASRLGVGLAIIDKRRERPGIAEAMHVIGNVHQKTCIFIDDIVDSAGTLCSAADIVIQEGAAAACAYVAHGVLSGQARDRIERSALSTLMITNTIAQPVATAPSKVHTLSVGALVAEAIKRTAGEQSVSDLFA